MPNENQNLTPTNQTPEPPGENMPEPQVGEVQPVENQPLAEAKKSKGWWKILIASLIVVSVILTLGYVVYSLYFFDGQKLPPNLVPDLNLIKEKIEVPEVTASPFANFSEEKIEIIADLEPYQAEVGLTNIENLDYFPNLSENAKEKLAQNNFAVTPGFDKEFFWLYTGNAARYIPNFISTDSLLHTYHLYFDYLLKKLEEEKLIAVAQELTKQLIAKSEEQYNELKGTAWENAAKRNLAYFWVANVLLGAPTENVPENVLREVALELEKIVAHNGLALSEIMNIGVATPDPRTAYTEDYSQYVPRGHYNKSASLQNYFKAMMWYGRLNFRIQNEDETRSAILSTLALADEAVYDNWEKLYEPINFFVGKADDLTLFDYESVLQGVYGPEISLAQLLENKEAFNKFIEEIKKFDPPKINSLPVFSDDKTVKERDEFIKGWRLLGQRFTIDASIFQRLICPEVGNKDGSMGCPKEDSRMLPKGLDVTAAMGSKEAQAILTDLGEMEYAKYPENLSKLQTYITSLPQEVWSQNLYWGWLYTLKTLLVERLTGWPSFMTNQAWVRKDLNTYLGSWTELKHDTILYAKQAYAGAGASGPPPAKDDRGYIEPNPELYNRLAALLKMTVEGLNNRSLLSEENKQNLNKLGLLATNLRDLSLKELKGEALSEEEYAFIKGYGSVLQELWLATFSAAEKAESDTLTLMDENPAALVADVATDPNGQVLEEAIGWVNYIYVVVPIGGQLRITRGGVFSQYEFPWPMADRLTDEKWKEMLKTGSELPEMDSWKRIFIVE